MPQINPLLYGAYKWLGSQVAEVEPLMGKMACMRNVERLQYADIEIIKLFFKNEKLNAFLSLMQRAIQIRGLALWPRTEITDLSAKAQAHPVRQTKDLGDRIPSDLSGIEALIYGSDNKKTME